MFLVHSVFTWHDFFYTFPFNNLKTMLTKNNLLTLTVLPIFLLVNSICNAQNKHSGGKKNKNENEVADVGQDDLSALVLQ